MSKKTKDSNGAPPVMDDQPKEQPKPKGHPLDGIEFTPIQTRIMAIMKDGRAHTREEIWKCLGDPIAPISYIYQHITLIRKKINHLGYDLAYRRDLYLLADFNPADYD